MGWVGQNSENPPMRVVIHSVSARSFDDAADSHHSDDADADYTVYDPGGISDSSAFSGVTMTILPATATLLRHERHSLSTTTPSTASSFTATPTT